MSEKILFTRRWHRALYWSSPVSPIFCIQVFIESVVTIMWSGWLYTAMIGSEILKLLNHARPQVCSDSVKIDSSATHCDQVWSQCPMLGPELELTNIGSSNTGAQDRSSPSIATSSFFCNQVFFEDDPSSSTSLFFGRHHDQILATAWNQVKIQEILQWEDRWLGVSCHVVPSVHKWSMLTWHSVKCWAHMELTNTVLGPGVELTNTPKTAQWYWHHYSRHKVLTRRFVLAALWHWGKLSLVIDRKTKICWSILHMAMFDSKCDGVVKNRIILQNSLILN